MIKVGVRLNERQKETFLLVEVGEGRILPCYSCTSHVHFSWWFLHFLPEKDVNLLFPFSCSFVFDSFVIPWAVACQAPLAMGFPRQEYWSGLPFPPPGDLSNTEIEPMSLVPPTLVGGFFTAAPLSNIWVLLLLMLLTPKSKCQELVFLPSSLLSFLAFLIRY